MDKTKVNKFVDDIMEQAATGPSLTDVNMIQKNSLSPAMGKYIKERLHSFMIEAADEVATGITVEALNATGLEGNQTEIGTFLLGLTTKLRAQVAKMYARDSFTD